MHHYQTISSILLALILTPSLHSQRHHTSKMYIEAGSGINLSYSDTGGGSPGLSIQGSVLFDLHPSWRLGANVGLHRTNGREYEYRSNLVDLSVKGVYAVRFKRYPPKKWKRKLEPRVFATLGLLQVQSIHNQQLSTNSNDTGIPIAPAFSGGVGLAYVLNNDLSLVMEGGSNISTSTDIFHTFMLKFIYKVPAAWN